ncbi:ribosomal protein S5 domain 2-like protein [Lactarius sanguifluus]|nr:ribosomal protein S5 domain 2-like protein [Lactarius sanguifluus]
MSNNLDAIVTHKLPLPEPLATSTEILDRQSTFVAHIFRAATPQKARSIHSHVRQVLHAKRPASHEIMAWRCMVLKEGRTGLRGDDDFKIEEGSEDDGEQWAGTHVLKMMRSEAIVDAVVIVSRWYGGTMLGPIRFTHIQDCAREVCQVFRVEDEMQDCISTLKSLDDILADLREELANAKKANRQSPDSEAKPHTTKKDYSALQKSLDMVKARRQISAREKAIESVKRLINEERSSA